MPLKSLTYLGKLITVDSRNTYQHSRHIAQHVKLMENGCLVPKRNVLLTIYVR